MENLAVYIVKVKQGGYRINWMYIRPSWGKRTRPKYKGNDFCFFQTPYAKIICRYLKLRLFRNKPKGLNLSKKDFYYCKDILYECKGKSKSQIHKIFRYEKNKINENRKIKNRVLDVEPELNIEEDMTELKDRSEAIKEEKERVKDSIENPVNHGEITTTENEEDIIHQ